ncbi:MAG TPA: hypothetical protein ENN73_02430 [Firmicutes bacterium]|nr:hypothetical protein [Bacillota bacterium]
MKELLKPLKPNKEQKMKYLKYLIIICIMFSAFSAGAEYTEPAQYLTYTPGGRALAMGGAFSSIANDSSATFYNPAGIVQLRGASGELYYAMLDLDRTYIFLSYASPVTKSLSVGGYLLQYTISDIVGHDEIAFSTGTFDISSNVLAISVGYRVSKQWALGLNLKSLSQNFRENTAEAFGADFAILYGIDDKLGASLVFRDISEKFSWDSGFEEEVPMITQFGASYKIDRSWTASLEMSSRKDEKSTLHFGAEYSMGDLVAALGYSDSLFSAGIGGNFKISRTNSIGVNLVYKTEKEGFKPQLAFSVSYLTK